MKIFLTIILFFILVKSLGFSNFDKNLTKKINLNQIKKISLEDKLNEKLEIKDVSKFLAKMSYLESRDSFYIVNKYGYIGKYQFGQLALLEIGKDSTFKQEFIDFDLEERKEFWSEEEQDKDMIKLLIKTKTYFVGYDKYINTKINGVKITWTNLLAATHLCGISNMKKYLESNGEIDFKDANNTPISKYLKEFKHYNIEQIWN